MNTYSAYYNSEIGMIRITGTEAGILSVAFVNDSEKTVDMTPPCLQECIKQLDEYFRGTRKEFSVNLLLQGTEFQKQVWQQLLKIPCGKVVSYLDIATAIGKPKACQAVGRANGQNKIAIIVPCHRVVGTDGKLTGYAGGLWRKEWLLKHENAYLL